MVATYSRKIVGLEWELTGELVPHGENTFQAEMEGFLHLLTLKNKSALNVDDLLGMLHTLGSVHQGYFQRAYDLLTDLRVEEAPVSRGGMPGMVKHVYYLRFEDHDLSLAPLVETFVTHVNLILDSWISEASIEVKMEVAEATEQFAAARGNL